jgi:hemerythrin-like domain-containing protein
MKATHILMEEHRLIERVLTATQTAASRVLQGAELRPAFFINVALFIRNFADGVHHRKEEGVLFIAMNQAGMPTQGSPIGVMLADHEQGREFTREMDSAAKKWDAGDASACHAVVHNAQGYAALLRQHIYKEDNILFPMAGRIIPVERQKAVDAEFERIQQEDTAAGLYEKYLALAEVLEKDSVK